MTKTINELVEICHLFNEGEPGGDMLACNASTIPGVTVVVNGQKPDAGAQTPKFVVPSGKKIRLRLLSEGLSRHFRLKLLNSGDNKLYRIGGQGGLLDNVELNGGTKGTWETSTIWAKSRSARATGQTLSSFPRAAREPSFNWSATRSPTLQDKHRPAG